MIDNRDKLWIGKYVDEGQTCARYTNPKRDQGDF